MACVERPRCSRWRRLSLSLRERTKKDECSFIHRRSLRVVGDGAQPHLRLWAEAAPVGFADQAASVLPAVLWAVQGGNVLVLAQGARLFGSHGQKNPRPPDLLEFAPRTAAVKANRAIGARHEAL